MDSRCEFPLKVTVCCVSVSLKIVEKEEDEEDDGSGGEKKVSIEFVIFIQIDLFGRISPPPGEGEGQRPRQSLGNIHNIWDQLVLVKMCSSSSFSHQLGATR